MKPCRSEQTAVRGTYVKIWESIIEKIESLDCGSHPDVICLK